MEACSLDSAIRAPNDADRPPRGTIGHAAADLLSNLPVPTRRAIPAERRRRPFAARTTRPAFHERQCLQLIRFDVVRSMSAATFPAKIDSQKRTSRLPRWQPPARRLHLQSKDFCGASRNWSKTQAIED